MAQGKSRRFIKNFLDVPRWAGVDTIKHAGKSIKSLAKSLFTVKQPEFNETFDEAITRLKLSEEDLSKRQRMYGITAGVYFVSACLMLVYCVHLLMLGHHMSMVTTFALVMLLLAFFFRDHFWYTQMKHRRLGFTFKEWLSAFFTKK